jgi:class 3 adenylate cyclase
MDDQDPTLSPNTLTGDIRDFMLAWLRNMKKPFEQMGENEQWDVIEATEKSARHLVGGVINVVSAHGFPRALVKIGQFTVKDGIEAKIVSQRSEKNLLNFNDFAGRNAVLIFADPDDFDAQRAPAVIFKKQRDLEEVIAAASEKEPVFTGGPIPVPTATPAPPPAARATGVAALAALQNAPRPEMRNRDQQIDPETGGIVDIPTDPGPLPQGLVRNPNPAKPGAIDPGDPGEPETVTINDDAPVSAPSTSDPFDEEPERGGTI